MSGRLTTFRGPSDFHLVTQTPTPRRKAFRTLTGLGLLALTNPLRAESPQEVKDAILAVEKQYDEAFNKRDPAALASLYSEDAQIHAPDKEVIKGRQNIERHWKEEMKISTAAGEKNSGETTEVLAFGEVAHETGHWVAKKSNGTISSHGKYFVLWKKQGSRWMLHREIWNQTGAPKK